MKREPRVAVLIPCFNEEAAVGQVVRDFRAALPDAAIYVYDNNSTDRTIEIAHAEGAHVRRETRQGKGNVVRRMFADIDADIYVLVDGDATYDAASAPKLIARLLDDHLDVVLATRVHTQQSAYRPGHVTGNRALAYCVGRLFGATPTDILSGYRVCSRRFVKSFPGLSSGFEIETELTVHALELALPAAEIPAPYYARPENSASKLSTWRDGFRILFTILRLWRSERPLVFFAGIGAGLASLSLVLAIPIVLHFLAEGNVPRVPTAILSMGLMLAAFVCFASALILDTVTRGRREMKLLAYLAHRAPNAGDAG